MTTMVGEVYEALLEAGASPDKARRAAESVASYERVTTTDIGELKRDLTEFRAETRGELTLLKWMVGVVLAIVIAVLAKLLFP